MIESSEHLQPPIKIPTFHNIEINQKYELTITIKNEGQHNEKIRLLPPTSPHFTVKNQINPFTIAPGLCWKVLVYFCLKVGGGSGGSGNGGSGGSGSGGDNSGEVYEDQVVFVGGGFKKKLKLRAMKPNFVLVMPKIFKLGLVRISKQSKFSLPIQNTGKQDVQIAMMRTSSPTITLQSPKIIVKKQSKSELQIRVKKTTSGIIEEFIYFPNGESIELKGICAEETVDVYGDDGEIMREGRFGVVYVGERVERRVFVVNNSPVRIQGLVKVFDKNMVEYANLKIDLNKMAFINRNNPKKTIQQQNSIHFKCPKTKFSIQPYQDSQHSLSIFKPPTKQQQKTFQTQALSRHPPTESPWNAVTTITQILYIKVISLEQPIKIPLEFSPIIPKILVTQDKFQFFGGKVKEVQRKVFQVRNCCDRRILVRFQGAGCFWFQGLGKEKEGKEGKEGKIEDIQGNGVKEFSVCFRPVIAGEYSEHLKITLFDTWVVNLKAYGQCLQNPIPAKQSFKINLKKSPSLNSTMSPTLRSPLTTLTQTQTLNQPLNQTLTVTQTLTTSKSSRYLSQQRLKRLQAQKTQTLQNKLTQRNKSGYAKDPDLPIDLAFDAGQNPGVRGKKQLMEKSCYGLFFDKEEYVRILGGRGRNGGGGGTGRINVKELVKLSEELTPQELQKIQVKCDRIDFGNVFVGSTCTKPLTLLNKNPKPILLQLDLNPNSPLTQPKPQPHKIDPYTECNIPLKLKPLHLGLLRIPLCYIINKQHIFQIDVIANVTLINLVFSKMALEFMFGPGDIGLEKVETLVVSNYGSTVTRFVVVEPMNRGFCVVGGKEQEVLPNSSTNIVVKYRPLEGADSGELRVDTDRLIVKIIGGAENVIKCEGTVMEPKYSVKQTQVTFNEIFISMPQQSKLTFRNNSKFQTAIKIQLSPSTLNEVISLDQKSFLLTCQQRKQISFSILSHEVKIAKGYFLISSRGGKTVKIPIYINFCFPTVEVVGVSQVDLGTVHIMTNHFQREITLVNRMKTEIKLESNRDQSDKLDYVIQFIAANQKVELTRRDTYPDSQRDEDDKNILTKNSANSGNDDRIMTATKLRNPKYISKILTLQPGIQTKFKMKFVPKQIKTYQLKIPLYLHKATREIDPIPQKIKCKAVEPLFYLNPYSLTFNNVIICENKYAYKREFQVINPHDRDVDWQIGDGQEVGLFIFQERGGRLGAKESKRVNVYFHPVKEGASSYKIKFFSSLDPEIQVELQVNCHAVSPRISFNKNLLILPVVPIKTESKGMIQIENYGYQAVTISKAKFTQTFQGIDLKYTFLDGKLLSLAKKKLKLQITFKSDIPISFTTHLQIFDEFGDKISIPISATADNCILTTYPYLQMNNSTIVYDNAENMVKLLVSKTFSAKNKQTNISGSSAVTGNFIRKWCNYQLNLQMGGFPDGFVESKGMLLYQMIIKMTNGRPIIKKPCFTSQEKLPRMLQLHNYYSQVIKTLQLEGAFLNHIRPEYLLNLNEYLLYMLHKQYIIEQDEFQYISHDSWTILFYQLCKLYIQPTVNQKFIQKFNYKHKVDKSFNSLLYSESELFVLGFINQFLGEDKVYSLGDQAKLFQVIQRILERTFKLSLGEELAKLKINADSLMLHQFLILVSKFLFSHLHQFGLSMFLQPNDLFTMGHKQFILFFISLMQNLLSFQTHSVIQFQSASGQKTQKIIQLQNPSKKKKIKYWVRICGSPNFKTNQKQLQIQPDSSKMLKITYHCKKNVSQEAQLILVPVKDEDYFMHAHCLNFLVKNLLISKILIKKFVMKVALYQVKAVTLDIQLPPTPGVDSCEYDIKLIGSQFVDESEYPNYYLLQPGPRLIKNNKDKCQIKIAPLQLAELSFKIILVSPTCQQYIYEFTINVQLPNPLQTFHLEPMICDKQQHRTIKIPNQNEHKQACLKFHREMNKEKEKGKRNLGREGRDGRDGREGKEGRQKEGRNKGKTGRWKYQVEFLEESGFRLGAGTVELGGKEKEKGDKGDGTMNRVEIYAQFNKSYRQYKSLLLVKNQQLLDYRIYPISTQITIKPKIFTLKLSAKSRQTTKLTIPNKMTPFTYRLQKNIPQLRIEQTESTQLIAVFEPNWVIKDEVEVVVDGLDCLEQHVYRIRVEGKLPDPVDTLQVLASSLFPTTFEINISTLLPLLPIPPKQLPNLKLHTTILHKNQTTLHLPSPTTPTTPTTPSIPKILCTLQPSPQQQLASIKLLLPKSEQYYEYLVNIKTLPVVDLGVVDMREKIGEVGRLGIGGICWGGLGEFCCQYQQESYLRYEWVGDPSFPKKPPTFTLIFHPQKQLHSQKTLKIKSNSKQYLLKVLLSSPKLDPIQVPVIITENLEKKSVVVFVGGNNGNGNNGDVGGEGFYQCFVEDCDRFRVEGGGVEVKNKEKVQVRVWFTPKYIGDTCKGKLVLKSKTLPELTYSLQAISKFKLKQQSEQLQAYQNIPGEKKLSFTNEFPQKQRFKFELISTQKDYTFDSDTTQFTRDIQPGETVDFVVRNLGVVVREDEGKEGKEGKEGREGREGKVVVMRVGNRKVVREYLLGLSVVRVLEGKKFNWVCRARQTIFQTIKLPNNHSLKQLQTDPETLKYITLNIQQKNPSEAKLKFTPLKPIKSKTINLLLISDKIKFRIECHVKVSPPPIDDTIVIRTEEIKETGVAVFRLTNVVREPANFRGYFQRGWQELEMEALQGVLEPYGRTGTPITIKFRSDIHNKRVEDRLIIETDNMYWVFKVIGIQQKILNF